LIQSEKVGIKREKDEIQASREELARRCSNLGNQIKDRETIEQLNKTIKNL
jgi:hypothetical protein